MPLGATTKNSEILEIAPSDDAGTHPPLGVEVAVIATIWKIIVAFPVLSTVTLREFGERFAAVSWNRVICHIAGLFLQSFLSPTRG